MTETHTLMAGYNASEYYTKVYNFSEKVSYVCEPNYFFEEDFFMAKFELTCMPDGNWSEMAPWKRCETPPSTYYTASSS